MQLKLDHTAFEKEIEERGIEYLIHSNHKSYGYF